MAYATYASRYWDERFSLGATVTLNKPASTADGDFLLMILYWDRKGTYNDLDPPPGSWNELYTDTHHGGSTNTDFGFKVLWRIAASEPASYVCGLSGASFLVGGMILRYTGNHASPLDDFCHDTTPGQVSQIDCGTLDPIATDLTLIAFGMSHHENTSPYMSASGYTEIVDQAGYGAFGANERLWVGDRNLASPSQQIDEIDFSGTSTLSSDVHPAGVVAIRSTTSVSDIQGSATLSGTGSLTASGVLTLYGTAALSGAGDLTVGGELALEGSALLTGAGALTAEGDVSAFGGVALSGAGAMAISSYVMKFGTAAMAGAGALVAAGEVHPEWGEQDNLWEGGAAGDDELWTGSGDDGTILWT